MLGCDVVRALQNLAKAAGYEVLANGDLICTATGNRFDGRSEREKLKAALDGVDIGEIRRILGIQ